MKNKLFFALLALLCVGCGQKGKLYLPPPEPEGTSQSPEAPKQTPIKGKSQQGQH